MQTRIIDTSRKLLALAICIALVFGSFFNVRKAEAFAPAIPIAGGALVALAAELGISETALLGGLAAITVAGTGLAAYNVANYSDTTLNPAPGFRPWDDLTPQEKQEWVGQDGTALDYQKQAIGWWALQYGLLEQTPNGDLQPSEQPDPEQDPDGATRWQKARNVLVALGAGVGGIALNDAIGPFFDNIGPNLKSLLFGSNGLALIYNGNASVGGRNFLIGLASMNWSNNTNNVAKVCNASTWYAYRNNSGTMVYESSSIAGTIGDITFDNSWGFTPYVITNGYQQSSWTASNGQYRGGAGQFTLNSNVMLNIGFAGTYTFPNGATLSDGEWTGDYHLNVDYGQMADTPTGLTQTIINNNEYNNFINNYTDPGTEGYTRAVTLPLGLLNDPDYQPSYSDFVVVSPDTDLVPIPDDEPITPTPTPTPTPDTQFQQDLGERVGQLISQPFDQLFPFCLIADMRRLSQIFSGAAYGANGGMSAQSLEPMNGTMEFVIPLSGFNVDGIEDITIDLEPISDLAHLVRPLMTALFISGLLAGTLKFFLNRGGE